MHYRITLLVQLAEPHREAFGGEVREYSTFSIAVGANAASASQAVMLAERYIESGPSAGIKHEILEAELALVQLEEVPAFALSDSIADPAQTGVYWASGRIFAADEHN